jgi:thiol-disulfide isomerase/thioredoxin
VEEGRLMKALQGRRRASAVPPGLAVLLALPLLGAASGTSLSPPSAGAASAVPAAGSAKAAPMSAANLQEIRREIANRKGAPLLVNIWASWCDPCVEELPAIAAVETRFASRGVRVIGVSCDLFVEDNTRALRRKVAGVLSKARATYPNFLYEGREDPLLETFKLPGSIPVSILYDARGEEIRRWEGRLELDEVEQALSSR